MARIELPPLDADSFEARLEEALPKRPNGSVITAWHTFAQGVKGMRQKLQDGHNAQDVQLTDHKQDIDRLRLDVNKIKEDVRVLQEAPAARPFP